MTASYHLEWREFRSRSASDTPSIATVAGTDVAAIVEAARRAADVAIDGEYRLRRIDQAGTGLAYASLADLQAWGASGAPLPVPRCGSAWLASIRREQRASAARQGVREALVAAIGAGAMDEEEVDDLIRIFDAALLRDDRSACP